MWVGGVSLQPTSAHSIWIRQEELEDIGEDFYGYRDVAQFLCFDHVVPFFYDLGTGIRSFTGVCIGRVG